MPAEHVEVADEIAYAGTPHHNERKWADEHGWFAKAFTVTCGGRLLVWLLDRGYSVHADDDRSLERPFAGGDWL